MANTQVTTLSHKRYMQAVREGLAAFEKRELEFKAKERQERAAQLRLLGKHPGPPSKRT